jgi:two-component system NtrC family sensor kinase
MIGIGKTKEQLINELTGLRQRVAELEACEAERKQVEEALRAERNKLQSLIDAMEDELTIQDKDFNFIYQNKLSRIISGGDQVGKKCYRIYEGKDKVCDGCPVEKVFRDGKSHTAERRQVTPSGEVIFLELTANPIRDARGEIVTCLKIGRNITERKQAEEALRLQAEIMRNMAEGVVLTRAKDATIVYTNPRFEEMFGYGAGELIGRNISVVNAPTDKNPEEVAKDIQRSLKERGVWQGEVYNIKKDDTPFWCYANVSTFNRHEYGDVWIATHRDITRRKLMEEALRKNEEKSLRMFESVTEGISVVDLNGIITEANQRTVEMHGFSSKGELLGKSAFELVAPSDHEKIAKNMRKTLKEGLIRGVEYNLLKSDGSEFPSELSTSVLKDASGNPVGLVTISRDITRRKQAEGREKELQKELLLSSRLASIGELAAGVAHQINNPLTGVLGFSQRLLRKSTDREVSENLGRIYTEAERAAKVVQNLLIFARRRQPKKELSDANEILQSALELRAYELKTSNIEVVTGLAPSLPRVMLDFYQMEEVFLNIILNAEQVMTEAHNGGKLTIETGRGKGYIRVTFTDDGPGIPAEKLYKIFDPFFSTRGERGGTGLGLSVCHGIIAEHGGRIYAKSKPGKGATFFVELPVSTDVAET